MSWYYIFIEVFCWGFISVLLRHYIYRGKYLVHIFQQSGYKINEFIQWLARHWSQILIPMSHVGVILITLSIFYFFAELLTATAITIILLVFSISWLWDVTYYRPEKVKKPLVYTPRVIRLSLVLVLLSIIIPVIGTYIAFEKGTLYPVVSLLVFSWIFGSLFIPYILLFSAVMVYPVEMAIHYWYKVKAREKIESMPDLKVIAITGSYGKTSTKVIISSILKERYRVCTTPGSYNTPMGICKVINNDLHPNDQILVLEMGARYRGNIDELCRIARPDISVITNIGIAHLESFGSREAVAETKEAIIRHLKPGGIAILNGEDERVLGMMNRDDITYVRTGITGDNCDLAGDTITYDENGCRFRLIKKQPLPQIAHDDGLLNSPFEPEKETGAREEIEINMTLLGIHSVQNALLAAASGMVMGIRLATIRVALQKVKPIEHRLELKKMNGIVVIDDAFNSNPVGAKNAITVLMSFKNGRKFVVTPGMIELGERQEKENRLFGLWMAEKKPDFILLVGYQQTKPVFEGLMLGGFEKENVKVVRSLFEANALLQEILREGDVVLYENDLPDSYNEITDN